MPAIATQSSVIANSYLFLSARLDALTNDDVVRLMEETIENEESRVIGNHNMHSMYLWYHEPAIRDFYSLADTVYIDGMSLILLGRIAGLPLKRAHRAAHLDYLPPLLRRAARNHWRIFFLGSRPGVGERAANNLRHMVPGLQLQTHHGHFDPEKHGAENQKVLCEINHYAPHILLVGMGMPRQEAWILENRNELEANVISSSGAIMDYFAGVKSPAPRWLGPLYLEWLYRLVTEPTRLSRRYLVEPWTVVRQMAIEYFKNGRSAVATEIIRYE